MKPSPAFGLVFTLLTLLAPACCASVTRKSTQEPICYTYSASSSISSVPTATLTETTVWTWTVTSMFVPLRTARGTPSTITFTNTVTKTVSETAFRDTVTETTTSSATTTTTVVRGRTATLTSTNYVTTTATVTVPTPSGFVPITSAPTTTITFTTSSDLRKAETAGPSAKVQAAGGNILAPQAQYPHEVLCIQLVGTVTTTTITHTARGSTITSDPPPKMVTTAVTTTSTMELPNTRSATTITILQHTTSTIRATTTTTTTTNTTITNTVAAPAQTQYDACSPDNFISSVNGSLIDYYDPIGNPISSYFLDNTTAYDPSSCCAACMSASTTNSTLECLGFAYLYYNSTTQPDQCGIITYMQEGMSCNASNASWAFATGDNSPNITPVTGNGPCGQGLYEVPVYV